MPADIVDARELYLALQCLNTGPQPFSRYVSARLDDPNNIVMGIGKTVADWERFIVRQYRESFGGPLLWSLKCQANSRWISVEPQRQALLAIAEEDEAAVFRLHGDPTDGSVISLHHPPSGYVSNDLNQSATIVADRGKIDAWEQFKILLFGMNP